MYERRSGEVDLLLSGYLTNEPYVEMELKGFMNNNMKF